MDTNTNEEIPNIPCVTFKSQKKAVNFISVLRPLKKKDAKLRRLSHYTSKFFQILFS